VFGSKRVYKGINRFKRLITANDLNPDFRKYLEKDFLRDIITSEAQKKQEIMLSLPSLHQATKTGSL